MNGIVLINKPEGITSFEVLNRLKKKFKIKKIGHGGTIDRFASGLLIAGVGEGTKLLSYYTGGDKSYEAVVRLGSTTDTLDPTGEVLSRFEGSLPSLKAVEDEFAKLVGDIQQVPPNFSAVKIRGKRASDRSRAGEDVEIAPRMVYVHSITVTSYEPPDVTITVNCGKGTYIRSLARDVGEGLGCGAFVQKLVRTAVHPFTLDASKSLDELLEKESLSDYVLPLIDAVQMLPKVELDSRQRELLMSGNQISLDTRPAMSHAAAIYGGRIVAIINISGVGRAIFAKPERIIFDTKGGRTE